MKVKVKSFSCVRLFSTPWTVAYQAPLSMGFSRQEYWCGLPFPSPGDLPNPGIEPGSPALHTDALPSEPPGKGNPNPAHGGDREKGQKSSHRVVFTCQAWPGPHSLCWQHLSVENNGTQFCIIPSAF